MKIEKLYIDVANQFLRSISIFENMKQNSNTFRIRGTDWWFILVPIVYNNYIYKCQLKILNTNGRRVSFAEFIDIAPLEVQQEMLFHLDMFR
jgi:hypothetical protein